MLNLRRTREPRGERHAKANSSFPLRLVGARSGLRPTRTASGFPSTPSARFPLTALTLHLVCTSLSYSFPVLPDHVRAPIALVSPRFLAGTLLQCTVTFLGCALIDLIISINCCTGGACRLSCLRFHISAIARLHGTDWGAVFVFFACVLCPSQSLLLPALELSLVLLALLEHLCLPQICELLELSPLCHAHAALVCGLAVFRCRWAPLRMWAWFCLALAHCYCLAAPQWHPLSLPAHGPMTFGVPLAFDLSGFGAYGCLDMSSFSRPKNFVGGLPARVVKKTMYHLR